MHLQLVDSPHVELIVTDLAQNNLSRGGVDETDAQGGSDTPALADGTDNIIFRVPNAY
jgi:hypothetical protein